MGYEIVYNYHERLEEGGYDKENLKEMKKRIGTPYEDVPLSKLATVLLGQLARRDIWVIDVEVYEYKKTKINFRETKGGLVLKNKKFSYDNMDGNLVEQEDVVVPNKTLTIPNVANKMQVPSHIDKSRPMKIVMVDDANDFILHKMKTNNLSFTPGKKYPVYKIQESTMIGTHVYTMMDDKGREVNVSDEYFVNPNVVYQRDIGQDKFDDKHESEIKLSYGSEMSTEMPSLRRR